MCAEPTRLYVAAQTQSKVENEKTALYEPALFFSLDAGSSTGKGYRRCQWVPTQLVHRTSIDKSATSFYSEQTA